MTAALLTPAATAKLRGCTTRTLERERRDGGGPEYVRSGRRVFYSESAIDEWVKARTFPHRAAEIAASTPKENGASDLG